MTEIDVKKLRQSQMLSQAQFAQRYGFNVHTLQEWEQGRSSPDSAARVLLMVIARSPDVVKAAVEAARALKIAS